MWVRNHIFFACIGQRGTCETYINFVDMEVATTGDTVGGANGLTFQNNKMKPSPNTVDVDQILRQFIEGQPLPSVTLDLDMTE